MTKDEGLPRLMRIAVLGILLASCTIGLKGPTGTPSLTIRSTPVIEPTVTETISPTPVEAEPARPTAPAPLQPDEPIPVQFPANGTYVDLDLELPAGGTSSYSIEASQGQIMSLSVLPGAEDAYVTLRLAAPDGTILCPTDGLPECSFWRGRLPAAGSYRLDVSAPMGGALFILRTAINPPGDLYQYFETRLQPGGLTLRYSDEFAPAAAPYGNYKSEPRLALHYIDSHTYAGTNLSEAYFILSESADEAVVSTCTQPNELGAGPEYPSGIKAVGSQAFTVSSSEGAGAGNYYEQLIHRAVIDGRCLEVIYFIHSTNIGNYPPGTVTEFDRAALLQRLDTIFASLGL